MPRWNLDGSELFYRSGSRMMAVDVRLADDLVLGKPHVLFDRPNTDSGFDVALDGKRFLMMDIVESEKAPTELILVQNWSEELKRLVPVN